MAKHLNIKEFNIMKTYLFLMTILGIAGAFAPAAFADVQCTPNSTSGRNQDGLFNGCSWTFSVDADCYCHLQQTCMDGLFNSGSYNGLTDPERCLNVGLITPAQYAVAKRNYTGN
jgi:hypothetical protein